MELSPLGTPSWSLLTHPPSCSPLSPPLCCYSLLNFTHSASWFPLGEALLCFLLLREKRGIWSRVVLRERGVWRKGRAPASGLFPPQASLSSANAIERKTKPSGVSRIGCLWSVVVIFEGGARGGVKAAGGAREFVLPCSTLGIGQAALRVWKRPMQKCWGKDKVVDSPLRRQLSSYKGRNQSFLTWRVKPETHVAEWYINLLLRDLDNGGHDYNNFLCSCDDESLWK